MLIKQGGVEVADAPRITFDGEWMGSRPEFYGDELYWEAWFLSSGTLMVEESYTADAWGIGGGGQTNWSSGSGSISTGTAGIQNSAIGITLSGAVAVTIGAGGLNQEAHKGGDTALGALLICAGRVEPDGISPITDAYKRYRFGAEDKAGEAGNSVSALDGKTNLYAQGGWTKFRRTVTTRYTGSYNYAVGAQGDGFGGGGGYYGWAAPGALVIHIKM